MIVEEATYEYTKCRTAHMTLFGGGFFLQPNPIDFDYVFKQADLSDNATIYVTVGVCLAACLLLLIWAGWQDRKDLLVRFLSLNPNPDGRGHNFFSPSALNRYNLKFL
jgi:hypothetical protein